MESVPVDAKKSEEPQAKEPVVVEPGPMPIRRVLILADDYRKLLESKIRKDKKGKNRKCTNADLLVVDEKIKLFSFDPDRYARARVEAALMQFQDMITDREEEMARKNLQAAGQLSPDEKGKEETPKQGPGYSVAVLSEEEAKKDVPSLSDVLPEIFAQTQNVLRVASGQPIVEEKGLAASVDGNQ